MQNIDRKTIYNLVGLTQKCYALIPRSKGRKGLISIEDCVGLAIRNLEMYIHYSDERHTGRHR